MKTDYKLQKQKYKDTKANLSKEEAATFNDTLQLLLQKINELEQELHTTKSDKQAEKDRIKELKERIKIVKNSLIQEYILYTNCRHLHYKNNNISKNKTQKSIH